MRGAPLILFLAFIISVNCVLAAKSPGQKRPASTTQYDDSYEAGAAEQEPYSAADSHEAAYDQGDKSEYDSACPHPEPADEMKNLYKGHATFNWESFAKDHARRPLKAHLMAGKEPKAAFTKQKSTRDASKTSAVDDINALLPAKLKELDGFNGTFDPLRYPSYEGLAVGHHPTDPDMVFMLHVVNGKAEFFLSTKDGSLNSLEHPTKIDLGDLTELVPGYSSGMEIRSVTAFYDPKLKRYAMLWTTESTIDDKLPATFFAVSQGRNPLKDWVVWALDMRPSWSVGFNFCAEQAHKEYIFDAPQVSFSDTGIFIGGSNLCRRSEARGALPTSLTALYVLAKDALFSPPSTLVTPKLNAAVYLTSQSWYRSITPHELEMVPDEFEPFNSVPTPARPQTLKDAMAAPVFVLKVDNAHISVATLTDDNIAKMTSIDSAPKILAVVVGKGADYANAEGFSDGMGIMPQPNTTTVLELQYVGMPNTYNGLIYGATLNEGLLYIASGEYWGFDTIRMPSIYWAIIKSVDDICKVARKDHGVVASQDGLALAYPSIAARADGTALLAFSFSGKDFVNVPGGKIPAYPGVASAIVGKSISKPAIHIIKKGVASLDPFPGKHSIPWGVGSAAQVCGDQVWFAVPYPTPDLPDAFATVWYGTWITWQSL